MFPKLHSLLNKKFLDISAAFSPFIPDTVEGAAILVQKHAGSDGLTADRAVVAALSEFYSRLQKADDNEALGRFEREILPRVNWKETFPFFVHSEIKHDNGEITHLLKIDNSTSRENFSGGYKKLSCKDIHNLNDKNLYSTLEGGHLHLQITARCNMRCSFCYQKDWDLDRQMCPDMDPKWIYEYCRPLYERIQEINVFGGEITAISEGFKVVSFLAQNYPAVTIHMESNGLAFTEKWQDFAVTNLMYMSFSVNAASPATFARAIWPEGGEKAWKRVHENINAYVQKLREADLQAFAPVITMVVSPETAHEIIDFVRMGLSWGCRRIHLLMNQQYLHLERFPTPVLDWALREMLKMERVLAGKVRLEVKLFLPEKIAAAAQRDVDAIPLESLKEEYADLLELAAGRNEEREHQERMTARKSHGKKNVERGQEVGSSCGHYFINAVSENHQRLCADPWNSLTLSQNGMVVSCNWNYAYQINLKDYLKNEMIDWNAVLNCEEFRLMRWKILNSDFSGCMAGCPYLPHVAKDLHYGI
ncbi:radical SAM/SPASM domain-containing protein [uncultured Desulfovibrio sp.]|uniref:radical SAM/SPASM domain-containing protein n=1 Tax=uncultured Desulfovibrio sp. TaxID=167968 RepID=UPI002615EAC5|nr:radical SAM/SPASM domain-containing protein [uncultured Desulfovibrio sp.]